jgi:hypothetical protein
MTVNQGTTQPCEKADAIVENARLCPIHHAGFAAFYSPTDDVIRIPAPSTFHSQEDYFHTLYHELTHASGHLRLTEGHAASDLAREILRKPLRTRRGVPAERGGILDRSVRELGGHRPWINKPENDPADRLARRRRRLQHFMWNRAQGTPGMPDITEGMPLTWAREHGIDTRIPGFAHRDQDGDGVSTLMEWKHGTRPIDRLSQPRGQSL